MTQNTPTEPAEKTPLTAAKIDNLRMKPATAAAREKKPKVRRDGSIQRRGERKFLLRAYRGTTPTGKRLYFTQIFKGTSDDARKRLDQILTDISNGIEPTRAIPEPAQPEEPPPTVGETLDRWLKHKTAGQKARIRTISNYQWLLDKYVRPTLGALPIAEITESEIQELYNRLLEGGTVTAKTIRNLHKVLEPAFERAVRWKLIKENPCIDLEIPKWDRKEARYLTPEQTLAFLAKARAKQDKWYAALLLATETGARPNEYLALRWSDISFDGCSVSIRRSLYWPPGLGRKKAGEGAFEFTKPKTQRSNRTITVSAAAIEALRQHRREQLEERMRRGSDYQDLDLVFATELGLRCCGGTSRAGISNRC
jgi:integrase